MGALNSFNRVAPFYDTLAALVFGKTYRLAQVVFFPMIRKNAHVLIIGGGRGWVAEQLLASTDSTVVYVEASSRMLEAAGRRLAKFGSRVTLIHGTEDAIPEGHFDAVMCNFYLDLFNAHELDRVILRISLRMKPQSVWTVTDFVNDGRGWQRVMLRIMYGFFRISARITTTSLPDWKQALRRSGLHVREEKRFFGGFIHSLLLQS